MANNDNDRTADLASYFTSPEPDTGSPALTPATPVEPPAPPAAGPTPKPWVRREAGESKPPPRATAAPANKIDMTRYDGGGVKIERSDVGHADDDLNTPIVQATTSGPAKPESSIDKYVRSLLAVVGIPTLIIFIGNWIPEIGLWGFYRTIADQVAPVAGGWPLLREAAPGWAFDHWTGLQGLGFVLVLALYISVHIKSPLARIVLVPFAGAVAALYALAALISLFAGAIPSSTVGLLLCVIAAALGAKIGYQAMTSTVTIGKVPTPMALAAAIAAGVTVLPALSVGRWATAQSLTDQAAALTRDNSEFMDAFLHVATFLQWLTGAAIVGFAFSIVDIAVAVGRKSLIKPIITSVVLLGLIIITAGGASSTSKTASTELATLGPGEEVQNCTAWWTTDAVPATTFAVAGGGCDVVRIYEGKVRISETPLGFNAQSTSTWTTTTGSPITVPTPTASYGQTIVVAGAQGSRSPGAFNLAGVGFQSGAINWTYTCANYDPFAFTFSGSQGADNIDGAVFTPPGEGRSVIVNCLGRVLHINPDNGAVF